MKLKELIEKYGEREIAEFDFEEAFEKLDSSENDGAVLISVLKKKTKPKTVWDLEKGDKYFVVCYSGSTYTCEMRTWGNGDYEKAGRETGILFLTKEEAEQDLERRQIETLLLKHGGRRWARKDVNYRFGLQYNMVVICKDIYPLQGAIYFDLEQEAQNAIDEIGADRIKRALFEVR